jgi:hypothetical protein
VESFLDCPELFPKAFADGYRLKDDRVSAKTGQRLRRILCPSTGQSFSVRPSFVLPYLTALTDDVEGPLFLRSFGVPFWAIARVFGRGSTYWYRLEVGLGRNSIVGTTVRRAELPEHLLADEHHQTRDGDKNYIATVAAGCCLDAALAEAADVKGLTDAYRVFKEEAQDVQPDYQPRTVSVNGWAAWLTLWPLVVLLRCFLHGWLNIRARGKLSEVFTTPSGKVWHAYRATNRRCFAQRLRRLWQWTQSQPLTAWLIEQVDKLCNRTREYGEAYSHPRRSPDEQHARPGDAVDEPLLRRRSTPAWLQGGMRAALPGVGPFA